MHRCGVASAEEALPLARRIAAAPGPRLPGADRLRGPLLARVRRRQAPRHGPRGDGPADRHRRAGSPTTGLPCRIVSAAGTGTWEVTSRYPGRDGDPAGLLRHHGRPPSRPRPALRLGDDGPRVGDQPTSRTGSSSTPAARRSARRTASSRAGTSTSYRFDEEHSIFTVDGACPLNVGDTVEILCNYTPFAIGYFEAYHVIEDGRVVDVWPVMPRGPESRWLLDMLEQGTDRPGGARPDVEHPEKETHMRDPAPLITEAHDRVRDLYGSAIGKHRHDVVTPALVIDRDVLRGEPRRSCSRSCPGCMPGCAGT